MTMPATATVAQRMMNRFDKVAFDTSAMIYPASSIVISRHREERVRLASLLIHRAIKSTTMPLHAVIAVSSTPQFLLNELKQMIPADFPLHIIASNEADEVMPVVVDYLVQFARMGFDTDGDERGKHHIITMFDCTEADASRLLNKSIFCRDLLQNGRHFDTSCIYLSGTVPVLPPDLRHNIDYVFAFAEPLVEQRKSLYKYYFGVFDHLSEFNDCFERYVQSGDEALVINNRVRSNNKWHMISMCSVPQVNAFIVECQNSVSLPEDSVDKDFIMGLSVLIEKTLENQRNGGKVRVSKRSNSERHHRRSGKHHKRHRKHDSDADSGEENSTNTVDNNAQNGDQDDEEESAILSNTPDVTDDVGSGITNDTPDNNNDDESGESAATDSNKK